MALKFFWRCEGTTLDATHDYAGGATPTASANSAVALNTTAARIGTNGLYENTASDYYYFTSASSYFSGSAGAIACSIKIPSGTPDGWVDGCTFFRAHQAAAQTHNVLLSMSGANGAGTREIRLSVRNPGDSNYTLTTTAADLELNTWYGIVARWSAAASDRRIEIYNADGSLRTSIDDLSTAFTAPSGIDELRFGEIGGEAAKVYLDNIFTADAYDEPLEDFLDITSYTEYGASTGVARIGTPSVIESGGTYTAETGSNRLAVFAVGAEGSTATACETSDLTFGTVKAQLIRQRDTSGGYSGVSVYVIPEASIPSGSQTVTATFVGTPTNSWIICLTLGDCDQSIAYDSSTDAGDPSTSSQQSWTLATNNNGGLGLCFAAMSASTVTVSLSLADGWTEVLDAIEGAASGYWMGEKALTGASTTAGITPSTGTSIAIVAVAFRPLGIASTIAARAAAYYYN